MSFNKSKNFSKNFIKIIIFSLCLIIFTGLAYTKNEKDISLVNFSSLKEDYKVYIRIFKKEHVLELWLEQKDGTFALHKEFDICAYSGGLGPKKREGDKKSPEGFYATKYSLLKPNSSYHMAFNIGYPNKYDKAHGYTGSFLMVHGKCVSIGCYAMGDKNIEEIYSYVQNSIKHGQKDVPVHIFPFKMSGEKIKKYQKYEHYDFWLELRDGYDYFEKYKKIPNIEVVDGRYVLR